MMDYQRNFTISPDVCGGQTVIAGTRVTLRTVLATLADGASIAELLDEFPTLTDEDVRTVIAFAAAAAEDDLPIPAVPSVP